MRDYEQAVKFSEIYRLFLYLCSVILLGYAANRTLNLVKSRVAGYVTSGTAVLRGLEVAARGVESL